jgi:coproporphyrinogen III oxidase
MNHREEIVQFLKTFRSDVIAAFETLEPHSTFQQQEWTYASGGGGEMNILRGDAFEKAAVNWSGVSGPHFPMDDSSGSFFATGVSLITHMHNPHAPTVHMNIRYIETEKESWFGGGYDLTPMGFPYPEDTEHFHTTAKNALGLTLYTQFSEAAKTYFYIPHRKKERGVGGLFFDHYDNIDVWKAVAHSFLPAVMPIYHRRIHTPFTPQDKEKQLELRAHYVEFNLLYDRGTKFGFLSGGNVDAILCSMPPLVKW